MKQINYKFALAIILLALPMLAIGQNKVNSEFYTLWEDAGKIKFVTIPNRLFIHKDSSVTHDYFLSLLDKTIDTEYNVIWHPRVRPEPMIDRVHEDNCEVIVEDSLIEYIISELIKDDGILAARRVCAMKDDYEYSLQHPELDISFLHYPYSQSIEYWFFNEILCAPQKDGPDEHVSDSICNVLGLSFEYKKGQLYTWVFTAPKDADVFELSEKLCNTGFFTGVVPNYLYPFAVYGTTDIIPQNTNNSVGRIFYDMSGRRTQSPSGVTIVVEQNSDGTTRTEKKLF